MEEKDNDWFLDCEHFFALVFCAMLSSLFFVKKRDGRTDRIVWMPLRKDGVAVRMWSGLSGRLRV